MNGALLRRALRLGACAGVAVALLSCGLARAETTRLPLSTFGSFQNPEAVAVDQSNGDVYVLDASAETVKRFDSSSQAKAFTALGTNTIDGAGGGTCSGVSPSCDKTPQGGFSFDGPAAAQVAVDDSSDPLTSGDVYVTDSLHHVVDVFESTGKYIGQLTATGVAGPAFGEPCGVAVGPSGTVYVGDYGKEAIHVFVPTASQPSNADFASDLAFTAPCAIALGTAGTAESLMVNRHAGGVFKVDELGALKYQIGTGSSSGVAVDPSDGHVLTASGSSASEYDASGSGGATLVAKFGARRFQNAGGVAVDGSRERAYVSDRSSGKVDVFGPLVPLPLPSVRLAPYTPSALGVHLRGYVGSYGEPVEFHFEYGSEDCAASACTSVPAAEASPEVGIGNGPMRISGNVNGLTPGTTYYYRLVATNSAGSASSESGTFETLGLPPAEVCPNQQIRQEQAATQLPGCRGYELVSRVPANRRNGADVYPSNQRVQAASSGDAFRFAFTAGSADTEAAPPTPEFEATREAPGAWTVHGVMPPQQSENIFDLLFGRTPHYLGDMSPDLTKGVFLANTPLNGEGPNVREVPNLYLRTDLLSPGPGSYGLLTDADSPQAPEKFEAPPRFAGASNDFTHVFFESERDLVAAAATLGEGPRLYEWTNGAVRLAGVLPASVGGGPVVAQAGQGARGHFTSQAVSSDGSRVVFTAPPFASEKTAGKLYLRDDRGTVDVSDDTTVQVNASEKTNGAGPGGADPNGVQPATFWCGSSNLDAIFFTSSEALTDSAPVSPGTPKLYRYDVNAPAGHHLTLLSVDQNSEDGITDEADGVIGASEDGAYVYFASSNQLEPGAPTAAMPRIFLWHTGSVREVAGINAGAESRQILGAGEWQEEPKWSRVTPDGHHLTFISEGSAELTGYDQGGSCPGGASSRCQEIYLYNAASGNGPGRLQCVSCNPTGEEATADADFNLFNSNFLLPRGPHLSQPLSVDGSTELFSTGERLVAADKNDEADVYSFDAVTGEVRLISRGTPGDEAHFLDATPDGRSVFFLTREAILPSDGNDQTDVYDARVDGGASEPPPTLTAPCGSEGECRPPAPASADESSPASADTVARRARRKHHAKGHRRHRRDKHHRGKPR